MSEAPLRATRCGASSVLTLLFGKAFFRIHFSLRLEGLPVPIERKSGLDPCLVGPPYGLELPWIGNTYLDDFGRDSPASLNSTGDM